MIENFRGRSFVSLLDYSTEEIRYILDLAIRMKNDYKAGKRETPLAGKTLAMIFQKPSLRTMVSFQTGMHQLGGHAIYLGPDQIGIGKRETTEDIAIVLSSMVDGIMARTFDHAIVEDLAKYSSKPVINGLTDFNHPCQIMADFQTVLERRGRLEGLKLVYIGDGNNVATSLMFGAARMGMEMVMATPEGYSANPKALEILKEKVPGFEVKHYIDPMEAAVGADILCTDAWFSMGQEKEAEARRKIFGKYKIDVPMIDIADPECVVLHCLPAHYGEEITHEAVRHPRSAVYQEAENRLHAQKAIMALLMG